MGRKYPGHKNKAEEVFWRLENSYPDAGTGLRHENVFELLIATMLSARTTDEQVNRITERLFSIYKHPGDFAVLEPEVLEEEIKGCGLYRSKAKNIIKTCRLLVSKFQGQVPSSLLELMELPGVGRKTTNVVLSVGFGKPGLGVDTHVQRVAYRLGLSESRDPHKTEMTLKRLWDEKKWGKAHHLLIRHGRTFCTARDPKCSECFLSDLCPRAGV